MKRWYANFLLRWAFQVFRRYHDQLPKELNGIIWGEMTRKYKQDHHATSGYFDPLCSTCVRESEEERERQEMVRRQLKGDVK